MLERNLPWTEVSERLQEHLKRYPQIAVSIKDAHLLIAHLMKDDLSERYPDDEASIKAMQEVITQLLAKPATEMIG